MSFNTTSSFVTNTNWQYYGGETTMSYFSQMAGLTVQNFVSAAVGHLGRDRADPRDRFPLGQEPRELLAGPRPHGPLCAVADLRSSVALVLVFQGSIQNFSHYLLAHTLTGGTQTIAQGPVASQEAIKELGTNGGGFFNVNSAHPFENPSGFTNLLEMLLVLWIPAAIVFTYGRMAGRRRQGYAIYGTMMVMFLGACVVAYIAEAHGSPGAACGRPPHRRDPRLGGREHGGQGDSGSASPVPRCSTSSLR